MNTKNALTSLAATLMLAALTACLPNAVEFEGVESGTRLDDAAPTPAPVVCDPFDDFAPSASQYGLLGSFYYLTDQMPRFSRVSEYIALGRRVPDTSVYLSRLLVPTRPFDRGFTTQSGATLRTEAGDTLYEYFALSLESQLKLGAQDTHVGNYQLALLSDDGATVHLKGVAGDSQLLIDNDETHPTRFKVASQPVYFNRNTRRPVEIRYFQGPRYHISLILLWRPWPANPAEVNDPLDGHTSNEDFFDSTQSPPAPQARYQELLSRGWQPLNADNYLLREGLNPCVYPTPTPAPQPTPRPTPPPAPDWSNF